MGAWIPTKRQSGRRRRGARKAFDRGTEELALWVGIKRTEDKGPVPKEKSKSVKEFSVISIIWSWQR